MARKRSTRSAAKLEEVTDLESATRSETGLTLEAGLVFATFVALLVGIVVGQLALAKYFDQGLFG